MSTRFDGSTGVHHPRVVRWCGLRVHMVGIGGCGMIGAAVMLRRLGAIVSGSDLTAFEGFGPLVHQDIRVSIGHREGQLDPNTDLVVVSAAIPDTNPEVQAARQCGIPIIKYAELLGYLMAHRSGVAIAGTHGKSTTTAMCAYAFREAGLKPSFLIGARSDQLGGHSGVGVGRHLIVESCEFDRSFLHLHPESAAVLNVEADHLDCYRDILEIVGAFSQFVQQVQPDGLVVVNGEDRLAMEVAGSARARVETFGFTTGTDWQAVELEADHGRVSFAVKYRGEVVLSTRLHIPGRHNVANALAAIALAHQAGADLEAVGHALSTFTGVTRRMTWRGQARGVTVIDDYAHHPTEIRVTIEAARDRYVPKRTWVIFQPHQYSRTRHLMDDFAGSFTMADEIVVPNVYGAREVPSAKDVQASEELVSKIRLHGGNALYLPTLKAVLEHVTEQVTDGDLVLTMGAGDVWKVADELVERLCGTDRMQRAARTNDMVSLGGNGAVAVSAA